MNLRRLFNSPRLDFLRKLSAFVLILFGSAAFSGEPEKIPLGEIQSVEAVVHAPKFVGECWLLTTKYGPLEPTNLDSEYKNEGLKVLVSFRRRDDLATACMMGRIVTLSSISVRRQAAKSGTTPHLRACQQAAVRGLR